MSEHDVDERERAEAEALAEALEGRGRRLSELDGAADDALEAAALLRYSEGGGELDAGRAEAILDGLLADAPAAAPAPSRPRRSWLWAWLSLPLAGVAAVLALLVLSARELHGPREEPRAVVEPAVPAAPATAERTPLPAPSAALLAAQAERARPGGDGAALETEMRAYRGQMLHALEARYPSPLGMRMPAPQERLSMLVPRERYAERQP